jgi:hypothetical protein
VSEATERHEPLTRTAADEKLRIAMLEWLEAYGRLPDGMLGDYTAVTHFRRYDDNGDQLDEYEIVTPQGVSFHAILGLLGYGYDNLDVEEEEETT